jgi:cbb3-type cytochrome oxidase subunit 1
MNRGRALKGVLGFVGVIFLASVYPLVIFVRQAPG